MHASEHPCALAVGALTVFRSCSDARTCWRHHSVRAKESKANGCKKLVLKREKQYKCAHRRICVLVNTLCIIFTLPFKYFRRPSMLAIVPQISKDGPFVASV